MTSIPQGFILMIILIVIFILISIQFTLNLILKELRSIRARMNDVRIRNSDDLH